MIKIKNSKRGNAIIGALTLIPMLGFASLSVDIGLQKAINVQMQAAMDSAVMSGAGYLDGSQAGVYEAIEKTAYVINQNTIHYEYVPNVSDIKVGHYENGVFVELSPSLDFEEINSVQMLGNHSYTSILSRFAFGVAGLESEAKATAVRKTGGGAKYVDCYLPFAIPVCHFTNLANGTNPDPIKLDLMNINTVGWGLPQENPNTDAVRDQFVDICSNGTAQVYDEDDGDTATNNINLGNGQNNGAVDFAANIINEAYPAIEPSEWPYEYFGNRYTRNGVDANYAYQSEIFSLRWGNNISGVVPIVDRECGTGFTGDARILGWTYAYIYDIKTQGSGGKNIWIQFDFVNEYDIGYGYDPDALGNILGTLPSQLVD
jgi:hypothetical protein